jgi:2'-5' RNA ligase
MTTVRRPGPVQNVVRAFVAVLLPSPLRDAAAEIQDAVRDRMPARAVRWVDPANFHVTVRFLGDLDRAAIERARGVIQQEAGFAPIGATLGAVSAVPSEGRPSVIWVDLQEQGNAFASLVQRVEQSLLAAGFGPPDKPWRSHLTLGRAERGTRPPRDWNRIEVSSPAVYRLHELALMRSELRPGGPRYTALETAHAAV